MSLTSLSYDCCAGKVRVNESEDIGKYYMNAPVVDCNGCYPAQPTTRLQKFGDSLSKNISLIDISSELKGITRKLSECPSKKFKPCEKKIQYGYQCVDDQLENFKDCDFFTPDNTRMSNPPSTLRGTGWNRWEWLWADPQKGAFGLMYPFDTNVNVQLLAKDNHRACLPSPMDQKASWPKYQPLPKVNATKEYKVPMGSLPGYSPSIHWNCCNVLPNL
tara:strand:+ start:195 stop:848 length:654 start_codon:yes stop_codon:yes gene_type:complete